MKKFILIASCIAATNICYSQVSYRSKVIESNPYVPPVDLDLMREVLAQKQNAYNNNYAVLNEKFLSIRKMFIYVPKLNWDVLVNEYNSISKTASSYDVSDGNAFNYFFAKLDYLEYIIGFVLKNPNQKLADNFFKN